MVVDSRSEYSESTTTSGTAEPPPGLTGEVRMPASRAAVSNISLFNSATALENGTGRHSANGSGSPDVHEPRLTTQLTRSRKCVVPNGGAWLGYRRRVIRNRCNGCRRGEWWYIWFHGRTVDGQLAADDLRKCSRNDNDGILFTRNTIQDRTVDDPLHDWLGIAEDYLI